MKTKIVALLGALLFGTSVFAAEITPYGTFNYKYSHDENSSGKAYSKLEDNGSNIGIDVDDIGVEGQTAVQIHLIQDLHTLVYLLTVLVTFQ